MHCIALGIILIEDLEKGWSNWQLISECLPLLELLSELLQAKFSIKIARPGIQLIF